MANILKKKEFLISLLFVVLISAYGVYIRTDAYQFNKAQKGRDYWMLLHIIEEDITAERTREAHSLALDLLEKVNPSVSNFYRLYEQGRAVADENYGRMATSKVKDEFPVWKDPLTSSKPTWSNLKEFEVYLIVKHHLKFKAFDYSNRSVKMIRVRLDSIINKLDVNEDIFVDRLEYALNMWKISGIKPSENIINLTDSKITAFIDNIAERPLDDNSGGLWQEMNQTINNYPYKSKLKSHLSEKKIGRMKYIHSDGSLNSSDKINFLIKENEELLQIDSTYNWNPLNYAILEYDDRRGKYRRVIDDYEKIKASLEESRKALSSVQGVTVNIIGKIEGNNYEGVIGGELRIVLTVLEGELTRTGHQHFYITRISPTSGYINRFTNMSMPLYLQYVGDYEALRKEYRDQFEMEKNIAKRLKLAKENLKDLDPILLDLFGKLANK